MDATFDDFHTVISNRIKSPGAFYYPDPWWEKEIEVFTKNVDDTIRFIRFECTDEELHWLGEIFDDLIEKTQSIALLSCLRERIDKVQDEQIRDEALIDIQNAAEFLNTPS